MTSRKKLLTQLIALALGGAAPLHYAGAQEVAAAGDATDSSRTLAANTELAARESVALEKVTVTATKREETAQEVPTPITVLGGNELLDSGIGKGSNQVLTYVPNASAATGGDLHTRPRWWIRGVGTGVQTLDSPNPVGIYYDDVYISNASATAGPLFDLDRVEVLRGPQGTLWGKNTTGGAINFVSKKPSFTNDGYVKFDYGTYNDRTIEGAYGGSIIDEKLAGRASFHTESRDGRFKNTATGQEDASFTDSTYRGQLLYEVTPDLEALFNVHFRKYNQDGASSAVTAGATNAPYYLRTQPAFIPDNDPDHVSTNAPNSSDITQNGALLNLKWQLGEYTLNSISAYEDFKSKTFTDSDNTPLEIGRGYTNAKSRQWSEELRLTSPREDRWNWIGGLHYLHEVIDSDNATAALAGTGVGTQPTTSTFSDSNYSHTMSSYAIFGSTTFNFTDDFNVTAGLRWTHEEKDVDLDYLNRTGVTFNDPSLWWLGSLRTSSPSAAAPSYSYDDSHSWKAWTGDVTPQYKITENARVYFKAARGFRSGGYNTAATTLPAINQIVKPETLTSYEVGFKSEWFDGRLNANANVFKYTYDNVQINVVGPVPGSNTSTSYLANVKTGKASGAEFELEALPIEHLHLNASLGILNTKFTDFSIRTDGDNNGSRFVRSPHYSAVWGFDYDFPLDNGAKIVLGGDWKYQSAQYYFTTIDSQDNPLLGTGGFTLGNARLAYVTAGGKLTWTGYVNNISDKVYRDHALPGSGAGNVAPAAADTRGATSIYGLPRTSGVSVTARF